MHGAYWGTYNRVHPFMEVVIQFRSVALKDSEKLVCNNAYAWLPKLAGHESGQGERQRIQCRSRGVSGN